MRKSKDNLLKYVIANCINAPGNYGKFLYSQSTAGRYSTSERCRTEERNYFDIVIRGNYFRIYRTRYFIDGEAQNLFLMGIGAFLSGKTPEYQECKELLCKVHIKDYKSLPAIYREKCPALFGE